MTADPLHVAANETGRVRVFTAEAAPEGASRITRDNINRLLHATRLDASKIDLFPSQIIAEIGLTGYLSEAYDVPGNALEGTAAALDALTGLIVVIPSSAFGGIEQTLDPDPVLRPVAIFSEVGATRPGLTADHSSAHGSVTSRPAPPPPPFPRRRGSALTFLSALVVLAALATIAALFFH